MSKYLVTLCYSINHRQECQLCLTPQGFNNQDHDMQFILLSMKFTCLVTLRHNNKHWQIQCMQFRLRHQNNNSHITINFEDGIVVKIH